MIKIIIYALAVTAPILVIALGGLYSERSGIVNIGLEGLMGFGAFFTALIIYYSGSKYIWIAIILGAFGCGVFKNNPYTVAQIFNELLKKEGFEKYFEHITFAIYDKSRTKEVSTAFLRNIL